MLQRVIAIRNVGRFRNSTTSPNPLFAKHTLVFGANAYGKTTFCAVMRSVQSGDVAPVLGRRTLGTQADPFVHLLLTEDGAERTLQLNIGLWSSVIPKISVFDGVFVSEIVHSGDVVDVAHRRNLFRVIVGQAGVALAEEEYRARRRKPRQADRTHCG